MNWKECVGLLQRYNLGDRFTWPPDALTFDCEPDAFTISDVWGVISWVWTWPGDWVLSQEPARTFFEIEGTNAIGTTGSTFIGWLLFLIIMLIFGLLES